MPVDATRFIKGLDTADAKVRRAVLRAADRFAAHVIGDAMEITPKDTGALAASGVAEKASIEGTDLSVRIGFNTDYAAAVHERMDQHHEPPGQAKYLYTAMQADAKQMAPFVAAEVKGELEGGA